MQAVIHIKQASIDDIPLILSFIKELAEYEKLLEHVVATEDSLKESLFGEKNHAEVIFAYLNDQPVAFAVYFHNYSTFLGRPGIYLEDLYVRPAARGKGIGKKLFAYLAKLTKNRGLARLDWCVLDWNEAAIQFYQHIGATPNHAWQLYRLSGEALSKLADE